jgi:hypothetical protein
VEIVILLVLLAAEEKEIMENELRKINFISVQTEN